MRKPNPRTLAIFDYNWGGHIPIYHRLVVEAALRAGWRVVSLSGGANEVSAHVAAFAPEYASQLTAPPCAELGRPPARKTRLAFLRWLPGGFAAWSLIRRNPILRARHAAIRWQACRVALDRACKTHDLGKPDLLFLPYLDDMVEPRLDGEALGLDVAWTGIYMSASDLRMPRLRADVLARCHLFSHPLCRGVAVLDEVTQPELRTVLPDGSTLACLPDVVDREHAGIETSRMSELRDRAQGRKIVGLLGHLSIAKNLDLVLNLAANPLHKDLFFFLAGQYEPLGVSPHIRRQLTRAAAGEWTNVWAIPERIVDDREFDALFARLDVVFAVYRDFCRSSNVLTKAGMLRRPILVAKGYCMAERAAAYGLGLAVDQDSPADCIQGIRRLLSGDCPKPDYERFRRDYSLEAFNKGLADFLGACQTPSRQTQA